MRRLETFDWWPQLVALKDELSLRELAERFGVTPGAISAALKREGVMRQPAPPGPRVHRRRRSRKGSEEDLPPEAGEGVAGARPGSKDAQVLEHWDLLGVVPDKEVAEQAGVSVRTVASFRARHGIPAYAGPRRPATVSRRRSRIDPFEDLLGQVPDRVIAERAGVSLNAVRNYRVKRGIPAAGRAPRTNGTADFEQAEGKQAWKVVLRANGRDLSRVVLAESLVDAASEAARNEDARVLSVTWVGQLL